MRHTFKARAIPHDEGLPRRIRAGVLCLVPIEAKHGSARRSPHERSQPFLLLGERL
jgi:hypothetical protein